MKITQQFIAILSVTSTLFLLTDTNTFARRDGGGGGFRGGDNRDFRQGEDRRAFQPHDNVDHKNFNTDHPLNNDHRNLQPDNRQLNSLNAVHDEKPPTFSSQHLTMRPHQGVPTNEWHTGNNHNNNNTYNNTWNNNNNWNNNGWNNNWNSWNSWNTGVFAGAMLGATMGIMASSLLSENSTYYTNDETTSSTTPTTTTSSLPINSNTNTNTTLPSNEAWVANPNVKLPANAVVNNTENGKSTYYCRTIYEDKTVYGVFVPDDGCYVENESVTMKFTSFDVLITT